jgi:hypothetical protein
MDPPGLVLNFCGQQLTGEMANSNFGKWTQARFIIGFIPKPTEEDHRRSPFLSDENPPKANLSKSNTPLPFHKPSIAIATHTAELTCGRGIKMGFRSLRCNFIA